ncbi:hypothetical protein [Caulobacter phage Cr30]|uniref:hypothetical protein n=1 Tax=Caulobacter phage Cr30 TaxID=1357714 RepID=UPI0004A9B89B|nr:hypothetical protein OZ74_gp085 [Caulobacter phage Cr30]AGS80970.1 hypothetical protein [Caulobacter phage Cr30]
MNKNDIVFLVKAKISWANDKSSQGLVDLQTSYDFRNVYAKNSKEAEEKYREFWKRQTIQTIIQDVKVVETIL